MRVAIHHTTHYRYSAPVFIEPMVLRLRPRHDMAQSVIAYQQSVLPASQTRSTIYDLNGNVVTKLWFTELVASLEIVAYSVVETHLTNPFQFLMEPDALLVPFPESYSANALFAAYTHREQDDASVTSFASEVLKQCDGSPIGFLLQLAADVRSHCDMIMRPAGAAWPAADTLAHGEGSCRDLAVLFNECCRYVNMPARFVSGYQVETPDHPEAFGHELHAWSEVYLPGAGWRGFDPSQGIATTDTHVAIATGYTAIDAAPTFGTYRGTGVSSELETEVQIDIIDTETNQASV